MKNHQENTSALPALLRTDNGGATLETNSLCCAAAGITAPSSATAEARIPHEKLRGAALADATLNAQERPLAQPAVGYTHPTAASCIEAALDATLAEQSGTYATCGQMAQAIEAALQRSGFLPLAGQSYQGMPVTRSTCLVSMITATPAGDSRSQIASAKSAVSCSCV